MTKRLGALCGVFAASLLTACTATGEQAGNSSLSAAKLGLSSRDDTPIKEKVSRHAKAAGVPVSLAHAVVRVESNYRPHAANAGNFGLMQIRLGTARSLGYSGGAAGLMNPETNLTYGMKYLAQAYKLAGGDTCGTVMRYQGGLRNFRMNGANRAYCSKAKIIMAQAD
jgi:soluble lytic murein transglycosylase-like protein